MKTLKMISPLLILAGALNFGYAQSEYDDMYFTGKDREKREVKKEDVYAYNSNYSKKRKSNQVPTVNPTDSYSARNLNPEYVARANANVGNSNDDYFVTNYQYLNPAVNNLNTFNSGFNTWYGSSWYNARYFSPHINRWSSPYYNPYYDPFYSSYRNPNPWSDPYYRTGWSSSFSYHYGSSWNYGWGGNGGYMYGNPYYNNAWCPSYGYGGYGGAGYGSGAYYTPSTMVIVTDRNVNYGKRSTRSSSTTTAATAAQSRTRNAYVNTDNKGNYGGGRTATTSGRTTTTGRTTTSAPTQQSAYYSRNWRREAQQHASSNRSWSSSYNPNNGSSRSVYSGGGSSTPSRSSSSSFNSGSTPSRSSFNTGGGSRSTGSSSGGSRSTGSSSSGSSGSRSSRSNN